MIQQVDAVYENGLLRPSQSLRLAEHERVRITVVTDDHDDLLDDNFAVGQEFDASVSLAEVRAALSTIQGSMDDAINELRGEYGSCPTTLTPALCADITTPSQDRMRLTKCWRMPQRLSTSHG